MDYTGIIKRAWRVTWRYKILWLFGLFLSGSGGGGGGGNTGYNFGGGDPESAERLGRQAEQLANWAVDNIGLLLLAGGLLLIIGLVWLILSIAAAPALVHLVNEAEEGRPVKGGEGWRVGFRYWWRHLGLILVLFLPLVAGALLLVGVSVLAFLSVAGVDQGGDGGAGAFFGACCFGGLLLLLLIVASVVLTLIYTLALRFLVLDGRPVFASIGQGWAAIRTRFKDVALMWLLVVAIGIGFGIAVAVVAGMLALPAIFMAMAGNVAGAALVGAVLFLVMLPIGAIYATFQSSVWTVFVRDFTGRSGPGAAAAAPAYPPSGPASGIYAPPAGGVAPIPPEAVPPADRSFLPPPPGPMPTPEEKPAPAPAPPAVPPQAPPPPPPAGEAPPPPPPPPAPQEEPPPEE